MVRRLVLRPSGDGLAYRKTKNAYRPMGTGDTARRCFVNEGPDPSASVATAASSDAARAISATPSRMPPARSIEIAMNSFRPTQPTPKSKSNSQDTDPSGTWGLRPGRCVAKTVAWRHGYPVQGTQLVRFALILPGHPAQQCRPAHSLSTANPADRPVL